MKNNRNLDKISNERLEILTTIKDSIVYKGDNIEKSFSEIDSIINADVENSKSCKLLLDTKNIISNLVLEISVCDNKDDVIKLRKKLNYYINKIKKELKNRNIPSDKYNEYCDKFSYLKNDISEVIKVFNRENNILKIMDLALKDNLCETEVSELKKLLRNERQFNRRLQVKYLDRQVKKKESKSKKLTLDDKLIPNSDVKEEKASTINIDIGDMVAKVIDVEPASSKLLMDDLNINFDDNYLSKQFLDNDILKYVNMYDLADLDKYDKGFLINILKFVRNIPTYISNKQKIKNMEFDYCNYSNIEELRKFIDYSKYNNSLFNALNEIFSKTCLGRRLSFHSKKHDEYMNYLLSIKDEIDSSTYNKNGAKKLELVK